MSYRVALLSVLVLALGLGGCGGGDGLTAPDGSVYLEIRTNGVSIRSVTENGYYEAFRDGGTAHPTQTLLVRVDFHARGEAEIKSPVTANVIFVFEDGTVFENKALVYGPFTGYHFDVSAAFKIQDGLLQTAGGHRGQLVSCQIKFSNGQVFPIFGFYIKA